MTIQLSCPWCSDDATFEVDNHRDEMVCGACGEHMPFAPDPVATYELLYEAA